MKTTMYWLILLTLGISGCAEIKYKKHSGGEARASITEKGTLGDTVEGIPMYYGWPPIPYVVLGKFVAVDAKPHSLAAFAKRKHADAILLKPAQNFQGVTQMPYYAGNNPGPVWGVPGYQKNITRVAQAGVLVKFISPELDRLNEVEFFLRNATFHKFTGWKDYDRGRNETIWYSLEQLKKEKAELTAKIATTKTKPMASDASSPSPRQTDPSSRP